MSTLYAGDDSQNPSAITIPSDGDASTVSSVNPAFQALMDKICHVLSGSDVELTGRKLFADICEFAIAIQFGTLGEAAEYDAEITSHDVPSGNRKLLWQFRVASDHWGRLYSRKAGISQSPGLEFTVNAAFDGSLWQLDVDGTAKIIELFGGDNGFIDNDDTMFIIRRKGFAARAPASSQLTFAAAGDTITRVAGSWITDGFKKGQTIRIAGTASNNGTHKVTAVTALVLTVGNTLTNETITSAGITIRTSPWGADEWDPCVAGIATGNPASTDTVPRNMVFTKLQPIAWGVVTTDGAGGVSVDEAIGINKTATSITGDSVRITLQRSMASVNYGVDVTSKNFGSPLACHQIVGSLEFDIGWFDASFVQHDAGAVALGASFVVWGEVSDNV